MESVLAEIILAHPQVVLHFFDGSPLKQLIGDTFRPEIFVMVHPERPDLAPLAEAILEEQLLFSGEMGTLLFPIQLIESAIENYAQMSSRGFLLSKLEGRFSGVAAVVCGAGPSLEDEKALLAKLEKKALIMAGGSAIAALHKAGITPHLATAIDPTEEEVSRCTALKEIDIPLLFIPSLYHEVVKMHQGRLGLIRTAGPLPFESAIEELFGLNQPSLGEKLTRKALSVTTLQVALAHFFGCSPIYLVGVDLSYQNGARYASGVNGAALISDENNPFLEGVNALGERVSTQLHWKIESEALSAYASAYPETRFYNCSSKGLAIDHFPHARLDELLACEPRELRALLEVHTTPHLHFLSKDKLAQALQKIPIETLVSVKELHPDLGEHEQDICSKLREMVKLKIELLLKRSI